jgi:hypothetical protein
MAPTPLDLEPWRERIIQWRQVDGHELATILGLLEEQGVTISRITLARRLKAWGDISSSPDKAELYSHILAMFHRFQVTDQELAEMLQYDGFSRVTARRVKDVRKELGLRKRLSPVEGEELQAVLRGVLTAEYDAGHIEDLGRSHLYAYLRTKYTHLNIIGRNRVYSVATKLNPEAHRRRQKKTRARGPPPDNPGPNYMWCMDAHCKFEKYGIQIYAAIDAWSREVMWVYVGITARTAVSVCCQYLACIGQGGVMPRILRTDRGAETIMGANVHFALSKAIINQDLAFAQTFRYGTSKENQRIESWWAQLTKSCLGKFKVVLDDLAARGLFTAGVIADRIAILAIYLPILRVEVLLFVKLWSVHKIGKQSRRPWIISGQPGKLYRYPETQGGTDQGVEVPEEFLHPFQERFHDFDMDEYLPKHVLNWCKAKLARQFPVLVQGADIRPIKLEDVDLDGHRLHLKAYIYLRDQIALHMLTDNNPPMEESSIPYGSHNWNNVDPAVQDAFGPGWDEVLRRLEEGNQDPRLREFILAQLDM